MGVDRSDTMTETKELGLAGQSDGIFLIAQDTARHTLKILMIPRDTMTEIPITNKERTLHDTKITQLTMAYAYGDGREGSCENMVESVQKLLCGFTIDQYMAVDTTVVAQLNDAVGGVTVTIPTDGMEKKIRHLSKVIRSLSMEIRQKPLYVTVIQTVIFLHCTAWTSSRNISHSIFRQ